jgi:hypothetical protein
MLEIRGQNFALDRTENTVTVAGKPAIVVYASSTKLKVITDLATTSGPVKVKIGIYTAVGPYDFQALPYPQAVEDGPPIFMTGAGFGLTGDVPSTGTLNVLVVLVNPTDRVPTNPTNARNTVVQAWNTVHTFYDQASYSRLNVDVDVTANWHSLTGNFNDYVTIAAGDPDAPNIRPSVLDRLMAEAAQAAVNEGFNLNNYAVMACVINLDGTFIRAWGGWSRQVFQYNDGAGTNINITVNHDLNLLAIQESANWGRFAHELGHNIVSVPTALSASPGAATLGEDVYESDLVDPSAATAHKFEMMGDHDNHPLFSAYNLEKLGWYNGSNILNLQWDRNAFSQEYEIVEHGLTENTTGGRYHIIKIRVTNGLFYYVEVRQRPGGTSQVFDENIPLNGATQQGGVIVTKVLTDTVNINQQMRFITLLHDPHVLKQGDIATDPIRAFKLTVVNDHAATNPLVCRVRVEWAQGIADDPNGAFDLRVEPWDNNWQTPDIWIDRQLYGSYDQALDAQGRPQGNGDKPKPGEINHFWARIHCDGTVGANNVRVTFYSITPPGVGDNGNWAPIQTRLININANSYTDVNVNWVPVVGQHTCLKAVAEQQLGEITGGNNSAQENVFQFEASASSVPEPLIKTVAVRNPLQQRTLVLIGVKGVPEGFTVQMPYSWLWMEPLEERQVELTLIPTLDYIEYRRKQLTLAKVRVTADVPRSYTQEIAPGVLPGSRMLAIGGITAQVAPKQRVEVRLWEDKVLSRREKAIALTGVITPAMAGEKLRVDLIDPNERQRVQEVTTDSQGRFQAIFRMGEFTSEVTAQVSQEQMEYQVQGVYKAQAFVINSPQAAEAESNIVYVRYSFG